MLQPLLIAHRGSCAYRPEHTIAAYQLAILQGASVIEPDLVISKDGILVVRHDNEISATTNVEDVPEFADRKTTKLVDGVLLTGYFVEDFTIKELKQLRAKERLPKLRPGNVQHDGLYEIPTFQEVLDLLQQVNIDGVKVGVYPETKHPSYFSSLGLPLETRLIDILESNGMNHKDANVYIQSFEVSNLIQLRSMTDLPLVQLIDSHDKQPFDFTLRNDSRKYPDLLLPSELAEIAKYADYIAVHKDYIIPRTTSNELGHPTSLIHDARTVGLGIHIWTMRPENLYLPNSLKSPSGLDSDHGDAVEEIKSFLRLGIDGFFTDASDIGNTAIKEIREEQMQSNVINLLSFQD